MTEPVDITVGLGFLNDMDFETMDKILNNLSWKYTQEKTGENKKGIGHFISDLSEHSFFTEKILDLIQKFTSKKFKIERVYADGRTYQQDDKSFKKDERDNKYTFLLFATEYTSFPGGEVVLKGKRDTSILDPSPNCSAFFKSSVLKKRHAPRENVMGILVVYELEEIV
jgi:hypothetical protein